VLNADVGYVVGRERQIDFKLAIKEGPSMGGQWGVIYTVCRGQRKRERQIDLQLAIKEGSSMGGDYIQL